MSSSNASSILCEHLFSASKKTALDCCSCLSNEKFEQLQILKFAWQSNMPDLAASNNEDKVIDLSEYEVLYVQDHSKTNFDHKLSSDTDYVFIPGDLSLEN